MLPCQINFVLEVVIDGEMQASSFIDFFHLGDEVRPMAISTNVSRLLILRQEQPSVNQLVQQRLLQLIVRAIFEEWKRESHDAQRPLARTLDLLLQVAFTRALRHPSAPLELEFALELSIEVGLVIGCEQFVDVRVFDLRVDNQ